MLRRHIEANKSVLLDGNLGFFKHLHVVFRTVKKKPAKPAKKFVSKAPAKKPAARAHRVNREGQRWTENRVGMTLRFPTDLEMDVRQVALAKGDLSRIVLFAMEHIDQKDVELVKTRKADLGLGRPMLLHVGAQARAFLRAWAEREDASVNQVVVSLLEEFFALRKRKAALRQELDLELRALRGI